MVKRANDMVKTIKSQMRGGAGQALVTDMLDKDDYRGKARLIATITLEPGCSIGEHIHENEEEIFYIINGKALYNDNGEETVLNKGDACLCLNGQTHSIANADNSETLVIAVVILTY